MPLHDDVMHKPKPKIALHDDVMHKTKPKISLHDDVMHKSKPKMPLHDGVMHKPNLERDCLKKCVKGGRLRFPYFLKASLG